MLSSDNDILSIVFIVILVFIIFYVLGSIQDEKHPLLDEIRRRFMIINPSYGNVTLRVGNQSYTYNKSVITMCLEDPNGEYYDINTLMYVALHELAHVLTDVHGTDKFGNDLSHGEEFQDIFDDLLEQAYRKGVYNPNLEMPDVYCGVET